MSPVQLLGVMPELARSAVRHGQHGWHTELSRSIRAAITDLVDIASYGRSNVLYSSSDHRRYAVD